MIRRIGLIVALVRCADHFELPAPCPRSVPVVVVAYPDTEQQMPQR